MNKRPIDPKVRKQEPQRPTLKNDVEHSRPPKGKDPKVPMPDRGVAPGITG